VSDRECGFMPCELEYMAEQKRQRQSGPRKYYSRAQWRERGRVVRVPDSQAVQVILVKASGHELKLFDISQTEEE
jgi:hypothetical protein